jgi:hypothetical protein
MDRLPSSSSSACPLCRDRTLATALSGAGVAALVAMSTAGCLITSTPDFTAPQHTAPFLIASSAKPAADQVVTLDAAYPGDEVFSADVMSQDDPAGGMGQFQTVHVLLYIDYGITFPGLSQPYRYAIHSTSELPSGTIDQTGRNVSVTWAWSGGPYSVDRGCHTATLIVSHGFDQAPECPTCDDDASTITWQILRCDTTTQKDDCNDLPLTATGACATQSQMPNSCRAVHQMMGSTCPDTTDGGAP